MRLGNKEALVTTYTALGQLKTQLGETIEASDWMREAQAILGESTLEQHPDLSEGLIIRQAELLQHQKRYEEICQLLEPLIERKEIDDGELATNQALVLLSLAYVSTNQLSKAIGTLQPAVRNLEARARESPTPETLRYLGMALSLRAGTHGTGNERSAVQDGLSGVEHLLTSLKLEKDVIGSIDFYLGLTLAFALCRITPSESAAKQRGVSLLLAWFDRLRETPDTIRAKDDFFPACIASMSRLLIDCNDYNSLIAILFKGMDVLRSPRDWPQRSRALAQALYLISQAETQLPPDRITELDPLRWCVLCDAYPSEDTSGMILESFVWAAPGLVQLGHFDLVEQLRHYVKKHSEDHKDSHANSASSRLAVFVIASRCMTGRTNDALSALEELHRSANSEGADGADVVAYSFSVRNVVRVLLQNNRLEEADRVATESIRLAARFGKFSEIAIGMLECAVDLGLAYADRGMLSEANEVVLKLEALRQKMSETRELNFKIANVLLAIIRSYMQSNKLSPALTNAQRLRDLQSLAPDDYRIAGANVITCGNLAIVLAANGRIDDSISMLRRMFELCGGAVFAQNLEIGAQARNVLKDTSQQLLFVLDRSGNRVDLDRVRKMIRELSYRHSIALH